MEGWIYLLGGSSRDNTGKLGSDRSIEVYDPKTDRWSVLIEDVGMPMRHARAFDFDGQILIFPSNLRGSPKAQILLVPLE